METTQTDKVLLETTHHGGSDVLVLLVVEVSALPELPGSVVEGGFESHETQRDRGQGARKFFSDRSEIDVETKITSLEEAGGEAGCGETVLVLGADRC